MSYGEVGIEEGAIEVRDNLVNIQVNLYQNDCRKFHHPQTVKVLRVHLFLHWLEPADSFIM